MAGADYYLCDLCNAKVFYDTDVNYDRVGAMACICQECAKTHDVRIVRNIEATDRAPQSADDTPHE